MVNLIHRLKIKLVKQLNPIRYAEKIGVNFPLNSLHIYGRVEWGSEPWLISLGENVYLTHGIKFITHDGGVLLYRNIVPDLEITKPITVGNNVIILPGVSIENNVIIGAGAVVSKNIPDNSVAVGVPARVIKTADEYFEKVQRESLHLGHLKGKEKDRALMEYYGYKGKSKGVYF